MVEFYGQLPCVCSYLVWFTVAILAWHQNPCEFVCAAALCVQKTLLHSSHSVTLALTLFPSPPPQWFLSLWRRGWGIHVQLILEITVIYSLCMLAIGGLFWSWSTATRSFFDDGWNILIFGHNYQLLGVGLILCPLNTVIVVGSLLESMSYLAISYCYDNG